MDWCADVHVTSPPPVAGDRVPPDPVPGEVGSRERRCARGGAWLTVGAYVRSANRGGDQPYNRISYHGFRLARRIGSALDLGPGR
jgi:formylglycine-generating enzyme required for sulfatase activity